jgi:hypothetical protein
MFFLQSKAESNMSQLVSFITIGLCASSILAAEPRAPVISRLSRVNAPGTIGVVVDAGRDQGVKLFDVCDVYRKQQPIGSLRITEVAANHSSAEITSVRAEERLTVGDRVVVDVALQFLRNLRPDTAIVKPAELARTHAAIDIRSDLKRVLYYGKPWSQGKALIDEETGYPITVAAGCAVTKDFVDFVEGYNATVREYFRKHETGSTRGPASTRQSHASNAAPSSSDELGNQKYAADRTVPRWLRRSPGTQLVEHSSYDHVSGTIMDESGMPVAGCEVSFPGAALVRTNDAGQFQYSLKQGRQLVLRARHPDYRTWYGAPFGGDVLRIQLQRKPQIERGDRTRSMTVRLIDSRNAEPIAGVSVEVERWEGPRAKTIAASAVTNVDGVAEFHGLDFIRYRLRQRADKPVPYIGQSSHPSRDALEVVILLDRACELTLRAVDSETGKGIAGVKFARERAAGEYWAQPVVPDILGIDPAEYRDVVTDEDGCFRCLVGPITWSYMVWKFAGGFNRIVPIDGRQEVEIETPPGCKVKYTFRLMR